MFSHMFYSVKLLFAIERGAIQYKWRRHRFLASKQRLTRPGSRTGERARARAGIFPMCGTAGELPGEKDIIVGFTACH